MRPIQIIKIFLSKKLIMQRVIGTFDTHSIVIYRNYFDTLI